MSHPGAHPVVLRDVLTLGRPVRLSELYDQRTGNFVGVGLYPEEKMDPLVVETKVDSSSLSLSLSKTHEDKTKLLDISAELSLNVLGGLISVSGSAQYVKDVKSNTQQYAYAMILKMRLKEKRLTFANSALGRNVLDVALKDYISKGLATHFVSGITYGGSYVVNLVARQSEFTEEELMQGSLESELKVLPGVVTLDAKLKAEAKDKYKKYDDKFDLVVHGDVNLDKVPVNPKDVLDTFSDASKLIEKDGGVPVSVTLQPISEELFKVANVFELKAQIAHDVRNAFANLDDVHSRFLVLKESVKKLQAFIPELARATNTVASEYIKEHTNLLEELGEYLLEYQKGNLTEPGDLLKKVETLCKTHLEPVHSQTTYPSTLKGLEEKFSHFEFFVTSLRKDKEVPGTPTPPSTDTSVKRSLHLSTVDDILRSIITQSRVPLFIMTPISGYTSKPVSPTLEFLELIKKYDVFFGDPGNPPYLLYAESLEDLKGIPNHEAFDGLKKPSFFSGEVGGGKVTWDSSPKDPPVREIIPDVASTLHYTQYNECDGDWKLFISPVDAVKSFTIQFRTIESIYPAENHILSLKTASKNMVFLTFKGGLVVHTGDGLLMKGEKVPQQGETFTVTFVQDIEHGRWTLYSNGEEVARKEFSVGGTVQDSKKLYIDLTCQGIMFRSDILGIKAFARALTEEEVKISFVQWKE